MLGTIAMSAIISAGTSLLLALLTFMENQAGIAFGGNERVEAAKADAGRLLYLNATSYEAMRRERFILSPAIEGSSGSPTLAALRCEHGKIRLNGPKSAGRPYCRTRIQFLP